MSEVVYFGNRTADGRCVVTWAEGDKGGQLPVRLDLVRHSPDGFEWGYGGSGPAQLALALLVHAGVDMESCFRCYQDFKWQVVVYLPHFNWELTQTQIANWWLKEVEIIDLADPIDYVEQREARS